MRVNWQEEFGGVRKEAYQISNLIVLVGRLHFCVKKAAVLRGQYLTPEARSPRIAEDHTSNGGFFVFLKIVVYKTEDEG